MNWLVERAHAAVGDETYTWNPLTLRTEDVTLEALANTVINWVLLVAMILAVIYLIYAGIVYITAGGNPDAAKKGQQGVINAIIGIVIIALAYVIAYSVGNLLSGTSS